VNVDIDQRTGALKVLPPLSRPGQSIVFHAKTDLVIGLTSCSAGQSKNFVFKPIDFEVMDSWKPTHDVAQPFYQQSWKIAIVITRVGWIAAGGTT